MDQLFEGETVTETMEKLKKKYLNRGKQCPSSDDIPSGTSDALRWPVLAHKTKQSVKEIKCYNEALHELFKALIIHHDQFGQERSLRGSNEELSAGSAAGRLNDSDVLFTETDVTLPSCLDGSPSSPDTVRDRDTRRAYQLPEACGSSSFGLAKVYQEMMNIYEHLKAERQSQQRREKELQERESRLKQQEETFGRLAGLEEMVHTRLVASEEKHQREVSQLQELLREKSKESKRLKSSFDTIKELNDNMKKQLNEISEQNKRLEMQSKKVQARLENLQRKYAITSRDFLNGNEKSSESIKPHKKEKVAAAEKPVKLNINPPSLKLLVLLLDWVLDGQLSSSVAVNEVKGLGQCLPPVALLTERCIKVLPLLADQLHYTPSSEPDVLIKVLRLIHGALRHLDSSTQHVALSATLRRIGEELSKPAVQSATLLSRDADHPKSCMEASGSLRSRPLYRSPCAHTRVLSTLIILRTVTQADVLANVLGDLRTDLMCEESRGLFVHYGGVSVLLWLLRVGRPGPHTSIDILIQLTEQSRYLNPFLEACSCEAFFQTASQLLKNPRLELPSLEKLSILLQKLSSIRKNHHLFELSSLHLQIQELHHKTNPSHTFLCLNLRSILHNLK